MRDEIGTRIALGMGLGKSLQITLLYENNNVISICRIMQTVQVSIHDSILVDRHERGKF